MPCVAAVLLAGAGAAGEGGGYGRISPHIRFPALFRQPPPRDSNGNLVGAGGGGISSRSVLQDKWAEIKRKLGDRQVQMPDFWGGYRVVPQSIEFGNGRADGLHDRFVYICQGKAWGILQVVP